MWSLYRFVNLINGKNYVGITCRLFTRLHEHTGGRGSVLLQRAIAKYGRENIKFQVLAIAPEPVIKLLEVDQIKRLQAKAPHGYNLTDGGDGATGVIPSVETRRKMSAARTRLNLGHRHSSLTRKRIGDAHRGKVISADLRERWSAARQANPPRARRVLVGGVQYKSFTEAAKATGVKYPTLVDRFRRWSMSGSFPAGFSYLD